MLCTSVCSLSQHRTPVIRSSYPWCFEWCCAWGRCGSERSVTQTFSERCHRVRHKSNHISNLNIIMPLRLLLDSEIALIRWVWLVSSDNVRRSNILRSTAKATCFGGKGRTVYLATYIFQSLSSSQADALVLELSSRIALLYDKKATK